MEHNHAPFNPAADHSAPSGRTDKAAAGGPPAPVPFLPGTGAGGSIADVLQCRADQIHRWHHTPEKDRERPVKDFLRDLQLMLTGAKEDHQFAMGADRVRARLVKLGAMAIAAIERIDMEEAERAER